MKESEMTILKLIGTILAGWLMSVGALITFVQVLEYAGYTQESLSTWRAAPIDMFYSYAFVPAMGVCFITIFLLSVYIIELRKKLQQ